MAETGVRSDPCMTFRFEIKLDDLAVGGFSDCAGLQLETEVQDYAEGGLNSHLLKFPSRSKQSNLILKRGVVDRHLWDWYYGLTQGEIRLRSGSILVRDAAGEQILMEWQFRRAFPCKWVGPELNAAQSNVAVETFELCHQGLERIK
jgi:phage tail-like protein